MTAVIIYGYLNNKFKRLWNKMRLAKENLWKTGAGNTMAITLDIRQRKLFYLIKKLKSSSCLIIDINNIEGCTIRKEYDSINAEAFKANTLHLFLKKILLHVKLKSNAAIAILTLYDVHTDKQEDVLEAEKWAYKFEKIISKMKYVQAKEIA